MPYVYGHHIKKKHIEAVERVQRRVIQQLPGMKDLPYPERLNILKWSNLVYRLPRGDMIEIFMVLHDKYYGEYSQLSPERGRRGTALISIRSDNPSQERLPKYGMRYQIQS